MAQEEEHFYTSEFFQSGGSDPFREHVEQYFEGRRTVPVSRTKGYNNLDVSFTFSDMLLQRFLEGYGSIGKAYEVALKYGFRGYSAGGKNGIFFLRSGDSGLIKAVDGLAIAHEDTIREDLDLQEKGLDALRKVKIVWHEPSGERVVGVYNTGNGRMFFLDFAQY
ncbi:hypothetical protein HZA98_02905 [Candidatus Woesearchaeota archaeon]|nr:hypothetical protein [Candidatus Woesearchaeota archaeon]